MINYTKNVKEMTAQELMQDKYALNDLLLANCDDVEMMSLIALVQQMIEGEFERRRKIAEGEIFDEDEAIVVDYEDVAEEEIDWSVIKYTKETLDTIADFMDYVEKPVNNNGDITSDRMYQLTKNVEKTVQITDAAYETCDIAQDVKYDIIYEFINAPKMHRYFAFDGFEHKQKMKTIYSMFNKFAHGRIARSIIKINNKNNTTPISYFECKDNNNNIYNPVEDRLMAMIDDNEDDDTQNKCNEILSSVSEKIMSLSRGPHSEEEIKASRQYLIDGLEDIANGKYDNATQMCKNKKITPRSYQLIVKKLREGNKTMSDISRETGWYIVRELEEQNNWSVEMMREKYGTTKGINEGYHIDETKTVTYKPCDKDYEKHYKTIKSLKKAW